MTQEQVVNISTEISYQMLKNGAEIYRVEQCVRYIAKAYGYNESDCFAVLTSLVVTVMDGDRICTRTKRVNSRGSNFERVAAYNDLSRYICANRPDYYTVMEMMDEINKRKGFSPLVMTVTYMFASYFFVRFYGGSITASILGSLIGSVVFPIQWLGAKIESNLFFINAITSAVMTGCVCILNYTFFPYDTEPLIIGLIMNLVPGVALTHCMRDLISNELISGVARLAEVFISAAGTAVGVFVVMSAFHLTV